MSKQKDKAKGPEDADAPDVDEAEVISAADVDEVRMERLKELCELLDKGILNLDSATSIVAKSIALMAGFEIAPKEQLVSDTPPPPEDSEISSPRGAAPVKLDRK